MYLHGEYGKRGNTMKFGTYIKPRLRLESVNIHSGDDMVMPDWFDADYEIDRDPV